MIRHMVETCTDDLGLLQERLDALTESGSAVVTVLWQARRIDEEQAGAFDARGSFVIISCSTSAGILREPFEADAALAERA